MIVSGRVARFLKKLGYQHKTIDEYWIIDNQPHNYLEGELNQVKPCMRISAPKPYEALTWLWEQGKAYISFENKGAGCVCHAKIPDKPYLNIDIVGGNPDLAIYNCLELLASNW